MEIEKLIKELMEEVKKGVMVLILRERLSESYYNDKLKYIIILWKQDESDWTEPDERDVKVKVVECGFNREIEYSTKRVLEELRELAEKHNINVDIIPIY